MIISASTHSSSSVSAILSERSFLISNQIKEIMTYHSVDLDVFDPVQSILVAVGVLVIEVIPGHQGSLFSLEGVARWPQHVDLSMYPPQ